MATTCLFIVNPDPSLERAAEYKSMHVSHSGQKSRSVAQDLVGTGQLALLGDSCSSSTCLLRDLPLHEIRFGLVETPVIYPLNSIPYRPLPAFQRESRGSWCAAGRPSGASTSVGLCRLPTSTSSGTPTADAMGDSLTQSSMPSHARAYCTSSQ